jgi:hypothetical protein
MLTEMPWLKDFVTLCRYLLDQCRQFVLRRATNLSVEHVLFGWVTGSITPAMKENAALVLSQLRLLWDHRVMRALFGSLLKADVKPPAKKVKGLASLFSYIDGGGAWRWPRQRCHSLSRRYCYPPQREVLPEDGNANERMEITTALAFQPGLVAPRRC